MIAEFQLVLNEQIEIANLDNIFFYSTLDGLQHWYMFIASTSSSARRSKGGREACHSCLRARTLLI